MGVTSKLNIYPHKYGIMRKVLQIASHTNRMLRWVIIQIPRRAKGITLCLNLQDFQKSVKWRQYFTYQTSVRDISIVGGHNLMGNNFLVRYTHYKISKFAALGYIIQPMLSSIVWEGLMSEFNTNKSSNNDL